MKAKYQNKTFQNKKNSSGYVSQLKNADNLGNYLIDNREGFNEDNFQKSVSSEKSIQRKINYDSTSQALNGGAKLNTKQEVIQVISQRWPHLNTERIEGIINEIEKKSTFWTMANIHDWFKQLVVKESPVPIGENGRPPTLYTYTHTPSGNQISGYGIPQGPHTLGYSAIQEALYVGHGGGLTFDRYNEQISSPEVWWAAVKSELSPTQSKDGELMERLKKAKLSYDNYYEEGMLIWSNVDTMNDKEQLQALKRLKELMEYMMQLDPYATYAWANKDSNPNVDGKGENTNINDDKNIDRGGRFRKPGELESYIVKRRTLI